MNASKNPSNGYNSKKPSNMLFLILEGGDAQKLLPTHTPTGAFTHRSLYTKELFTYRKLYTEKSLF